MKIKSLKGTQDILPADTGHWQRIEDISRKKFHIYGYKEIRTPIIEETALFIRSVGEDTDIVRKQMYTFKDQGGRDICLRPEATASVARAYLEHNLDKKEGFVKLFYIGPMFRGERPQAGRYRQFHQIGVEAIGSYSPDVDAEIIILMDDLLRNYGLSGYAIKVNSLGCQKDRDTIKEILKKELKHNLNRLCDDCQRRYETNIMRVLDCKNEACRKIIKSIPLENILCKECAEDFTKLQKILDESGLRYELSSLLVRGLDYYTKTVFEVTTEGLGAQNAIAAGGRYDNLISDFGGPKTGACGFAIGVERVIEAASKVWKEKPGEKRGLIFVATLGDNARRIGFGILSELRKAGLSAGIDCQVRSIDKQMRYANKLGATQAVIIGDDEIREGVATIRDMVTGEQKKVVLDKLIDGLRC